MNIFLTYIANIYRTLSSDKDPRKNFIPGVTSWEFFPIFSQYAERYFVFDLDLKKKKK